MLSYKEYNESLLGLGPITLGLGKVQSLGVVGQQTAEVKEEAKKEKEEEKEDEKEDEKGDKKAKAKKEDCPCACAKMTKEETEWWNSVHGMLGVDPDEKGWDGISAEPKPGELGYAPVSRVGSFGEQVGPPADMGADQSAPEGGEGEGAEGGDDKDAAISALLQAFGVEDSEENKEQVRQMVQSLGKGGDEEPAQDMGTGAAPPAPMGGTGGPPGAMAGAM